MSQISAEMDEKNIPEEQRNSLIDRVSVGMHAAEKKIDNVKGPKLVTKKPTADSEIQISEETINLAKKVRLFADKTHNVVTLDGKSYVKVGAYQYLAHILGLTSAFEFDDNSTNEEVWCTCILRNKEGNRVTETVMYANKKEVFLRDKEDFAVLGMAQTRAFVRAMKNVYGFIMELAGYQSVGVEEISLNKEKNNG